MIFESLVLGVHLASVHVPQGGQSNFNPGIYVRADGLTAGVYRNSLKRPSIYLGYTAEAGPFALTIGAISGYDTRRSLVPCNDRRASIKNEGSQCWAESGTAHRVSWLVAPSAALPAVLGVTPRLTYLPPLRGSVSTLHLSIERAFP